MQTSLDVQAVGARAAQIFTAIQQHPLYERLTTSSLAYTECWFTGTGYGTVSRWNQAADAPVLAIEGLRVLSLKAAVYEMTGDEQQAELLVPAPVDEMVHAILAQFTVMTKIQQDLGIQFVHATELEEFRYEDGCDTDRYYAAAGWGPKPIRYWLTKDEVNRRLAVLERGYEAAGIQRFGVSTSHTFDDTTAPAAV